MSREGRGRDLFIADNSVCGCARRDYPQECLGVAETLDILGGGAP